ncbi:Nicotinamide mononucleotide adenylyltransferase [Fulvia fulva]|uniref:Nicotinamide mononucleotide adenylyltransferase n=1 Tax=Passalora fulva TaxID=5499 RepID=A0A9Q8PLE9_PASFU|nr:Nicotinamide mononucleotide adenylyltransferase [Fulvia fulva]KAK4610602.1 Nicotinamide mononucleotide adenylyltransferase [Fulvia fulva]KAK4611096.1 Nicotinamide mononucleotide adenylyltransferase [Fulvia fulva]UJO24544.1 Nicotinamide mononucleotide adenylyltransferase [Fulvia fulva]WPV22046.1 Nicotinamide mononucleotide adenylyltransferase [Fulvia fulva]WPV37038.1 Nicotinamide mononucleotide adenylyltransferase [Fulvia fulva]
MTSLPRCDKNMTEQDDPPTGGFAKLSIQDEDGNDRGIFFHGQNLDINFNAILKPRNVTMTETIPDMSIYRQLLPELASSLKTFQNSGSKFKVLKTVLPSSATPQDPRPIPAKPEEQGTLFILDSSVNPPSIAHRTLAQKVLEKSSLEHHPARRRLLLLFAVMNADKAPSPASFEHRLTMMTIFARDLLDSVSSSMNHIAMPVDIGVTTQPFYTDKSAAIETEGREWYPEGPKHIHLIGFDTLTRFFGAKYYREKFDPPFSALDPYFDHGHKLRVTLRPGDVAGEYGRVEKQKAFHENLANGGMEAEGGKREWAKQVELVEPVGDEGVSSTKIRKAANAEDWKEVRRLCTPGVAEWVKTEGFYKEDSRGAKMA